MRETGDLKEAVVGGEWTLAGEITKELLAQRVSPEEMITSALQSGMEVVGEKYSSGEYFLPDMLKASRAMNISLELLKPYLEEGKSAKLGKFVIGTVKADMHDIGKNIVASFFRGVGFDVVDLGVDVSEEAFAAAVKEVKPDILGLSALLTTTMYEIGTVIKKLESEGLRDKVKIIAGGAPVTARFAEQMGADAYAKDGGEAVLIGKRLMGK